MRKFISLVLIQSLYLKYMLIKYMLIKYMLIKTIHSMRIFLRDNHLRSVVVWSSREL